MSKLRFFANRISQPSRAVEWILQMKQLPYQYHHISIFDGGARTPIYLARYQKGGVPVIEDGDFVLGESHAIMTYLADKHDWTDLYPKDLQLRAKINEYLHWHHQNVRKTSTQIFRPYLAKRLGKASDIDLEFVRTKDQTLESFLPVVEQNLIQTKFLVNTHKPTIADISCYCQLDLMRVADLYDYAKYPRTREWMQEMEKLPYHDEMKKELQHTLNLLLTPEDD